MDQLEKGQVLEIIADDPAAEEDIKFWAKTTGQEILDFKKEGYKLTFLVRKVK
jgi:TusA-related sulfurtransferase